MKKVPIQNKKTIQTNEGLASGMLDFGRSIAGNDRSSGNDYKQLKSRFIDDFKAQWKDWWNKRKDIDLTQDSEAQIEQDKRDARNEKRREKRKVPPTAPSAPVAPTSSIIQVPQNVGSGPRPVAESKRFLNKSIMTESEYDKLNNLFENIVQIE